MPVLLLQTSDVPGIDSGLLHLPLKNDPEPLRLLDIQGQLCLKLLDFGELHCLLQVKKLFVLRIVQLLNFFHLQLQGRYLPIFLRDC